MNPNTKQKIVEGAKIAAAVAAGAGAIFVGVKAVTGGEGNQYMQGIKTAFDGAGPMAIGGAVVGTTAGLLMNAPVVDGKPASKLQQAVMFGTFCAGMAVSANAIAQGGGFVLADNGLGG